MGRSSLLFLPHISNAIQWPNQRYIMLTIEELDWKTKESNKFQWQAYTQKTCKWSPKGKEIQFVSQVSRREVIWHIWEVSHRPGWGCSFSTSLLPSHPARMLADSRVAAGKMGMETCSGLIPARSCDGAGGHMLMLRAEKYVRMPHFRYSFSICQHFGGSLLLWHKQQLCR